ncbi:hypothetical protein L1987_57495 [Smallanthus sonchifolius]|uniref:Uncharacterized protein n=1 Tax=Smallanthus sonchifolius TaxID=185202 RepID=A0ACB9DDA7_9ASTR|nr:hypothetical protein L1987_57495 [Smallanthus sonchifolius]
MSSRRLLASLLRSSAPPSTDLRPDLHSLTPVEPLHADAPTLTHPLPATFSTVQSTTPLPPARRRLSHLLLRLLKDLMMERSLTSSQAPVPLDRFVR